MAVLADGVAATGGTFEAALPAGTLPPGIYLVRVAVFDALGREVALLHEGSASPGVLGVSLDGAALPAGVYVVRATVRSAAGASVLARTVTVAR